MEHREGDAVLDLRRMGAMGGRTVIAHHGLISGPDFGPDWIEAAERHGIELLSIARPGYAGSPPAPLESVAGWAPIVEHLIERLGIVEFDVLGISAGAPYAYALAAGLPERVGRVAILSGVPRVTEAPILEAYSADARAAYEQYRTSPIEEIAAFYATTLTARSAELPKDSPWQEGLRASLAHGGLGPGREAHLQITDWGFDQSAVTAPTRLWHAEGDDMVPFEAAAQMPALMPDAELLVQQAPGHLPSAATIDAALEFLASL